MPRAKHKHIPSTHRHTFPHSDPEDGFYAQQIKSIRRKNKKIMLDFDVVIANGQRKSFHIETLLLCHFLLLPRPLLHTHTHTLRRTATTTVHTGTKFSRSTWLTWQLDSTRLEHALYNYRTENVNAILHLFFQLILTKLHNFYVFFCNFFLIKFFSLQAFSAGVRSWVIPANPFSWLNRRRWATTRSHASCFFFGFCFKFLFSAQLSSS